MGIENNTWSDYGESGSQAIGLEQKEFGDLE